MTAIADRPARPAEAPDRGSLWLALAAPALILATLIAQYLSSGGYDLLLPESLLLMSILAFAGVALGALSRLRPGTFEPVLIAVLLIVFTYKRPEILIAMAAAAREFLPDALGLGTLRGVFLILIVGILSLCWVLRQHLSTIITIAFGTMLLATILLPEGAGGRPARSGALPTVSSDLAPVIHIILDEHIGLAGLPPEVQGSLQAADELRSTYRDFVVYSHAYSRFAQTHRSLASLVNGKPGLGFSDALTRPSDGYRYRLEGNEWFRKLRAKGYSISVYQSSYLDFCKGADACYTYYGSLNSLQHTTLTAIQRAKILLGPLVIPGTWPNMYPLGAMEALQAAMNDIEQHPRGSAYILHLILPHVGYLFDADCSTSDLFESTELRDRRSQMLMSPDVRRASYELYLSQLVCSSKATNELFDTLKRLELYNDATIIVHGDHGSRIGERPIHGVASDTLTDQDMLDHYSTLLAIKTPNSSAGVEAVPVAVQDFFAEQFLGIEAPEGLAGSVFVSEPDAKFRKREIRWPVR